jgi:type IV pilus modification protein PilV
MARLGERGHGAGRGEQGFTLIELMFASVYLSVGLLAIAAMEDIAVGRSVDAKRLTVAVNMATEMLERVRFNSPANATLSGGFYPYNGIRACSNLAACSGGETAGNATANTTASGDYDQWRARLKATDSSGQLMLPGAVATVTSTATGTSALGGVLVTVSVSWTSGLRTPTITLNTIVAPL